MKYEDLFTEYLNKFGEQPPMLDTVDPNNEEYLEMLKNAIDNDRKLTRDELADTFYTNDKVFY